LFIFRSSVGITIDFIILFELYSFFFSFLAVYLSFSFSRYFSRSSSFFFFFFLSYFDFDLELLDDLDLDFALTDREDYLDL